MFQESFEKFRQVVLEDLSLQKELRELSEREEFVRHVVELGAARGFEFTAENVKEAMRENRRVWVERWI
jgi:chloramphenicol O-acetyltransferase